MTRKESPVLLRSVEDRADAKILRATIAAELRRVPMNEFSLRSAVEAFVKAECRSGVPASLVITRLSDLIDGTEVSSTPARLPVLRSVILWCVDSYFGEGNPDVPTRSRQVPTPATASSTTGANHGATSI